MGYRQICDPISKTAEGHIIQSMWASLKGSGVMATMDGDTHLVFWRQAAKPHPRAEYQRGRVATGVHPGRQKQ